MSCINKFILLNFTLLSVIHLIAQPVSNRSGVVVQEFVTVPSKGARVAIDNSTQRMFFIEVDGGVYEILNWKSSSPSTQLVSTKTNHGIGTQLAGLCARNGTIFIAGSDDPDADNMVGIVKKADLTQSPLTWVTVAQTDPYLKSKTAFDHRINSVEIDPTGDWLFINSGSRTDHGESHQGFRELPITARILRIPSNSVNLVLKNDSALIEPYTFCKGTRNSFGMAWDYHGNLFATENAGDRDHPDELNWLREGKHYGFPWNIGGYDNPVTKPGYTSGYPGTVKDPLIQNSSYAWGRGFFADDPNFPRKPSSLTLSKPIPNFGPNADYYMDTTDFIIRKASTEITHVSTFTPHYSPVGIVIDRELKLDNEYAGAAFVLGNNATGLISNYDKDQSGGGLLMMKLNYDSTIDNFAANTYLLVKNFGNPTGIAQHENILYVTCYDKTKIYKVILPKADPIVWNAPQAKLRPIIDGRSNEKEWESGYWRNINHLWVDAISGTQNALPTSSDLKGRFKTLWKDNEIFVLAEIEDDSLNYTVNPTMPTQVFGGDALEVFIDEDNSGGAHTKTHNAFAYHISPQGKVADQCGCGGQDDFGGNSGDWNGRFYNSHVESKVFKNGKKYIWEMAVKVYNSGYSDTGNNNESKLVNLSAGKTIGFGVAYNDYDTLMGQNGLAREHLMGSFSISGNNNSTYGVAGGRNVAWQDASIFGKLNLVSENCIVPSVKYDNEITINTDNILQWEYTPEVNYQYSDLSYSLQFLPSSIAGFNINPSSGKITVNTIQGMGMVFIAVRHATSCMSKFSSLAISVCGAPKIEMPDTIKLIPEYGNVIRESIALKYPNGEYSYSVRPRETSFMRVQADKLGALTLVPFRETKGAVNLTITAISKCDVATKILHVESDYTTSTIPSRIINKLDVGFDIFPNPTNEFININISDEGVYQYEILSIYAEKIKSGNTFNKDKIFLSELIPGVYFIRIFNRESTSAYKKILKE